MGELRINLKKKMSDYTEIVEDVTADCPKFEVLLAGTDETATAALAADVSAWSDGYNLTAKATFAATYYASMETDTALELAFGTEALLASAPNGAYSICLDFAWNSTDSDVDVTGDTQGYYIPTAVATTGASLDYSTTGVINMYEVDGPATWSCPSTVGPPLTPGPVMVTSSLTVLPRALSTCPRRLIPTEKPQPLVIESTTRTKSLPTLEMVPPAPPAPRRSRSSWVPQLLLPPASLWPLP